MSVLPFVDPEHINLNAYDEEMEIDEIVKTEQWRRTEALYFDFRVLNLKVEDICHFPRLSIKLKTIFARDLDTVRKAYSSFLNWTRMWFYLEHFDDLQELYSIWGPAFESDYLRHWYFRMKNSEEKILCIEYSFFPAQTDYLFHLDISETKDVPNGAVVHDYHDN
ncbi:hypothetical protein B9Z55_021219 [Caenorhabditis nigoni]|uniref:DUF38 domain-containing protein n=1 Tax=Caenorhabditis nigoni TaxID=1611254 RepID=A0A2G5TQX9_9PELO|nr:hypothetical protein B9Z55_021219 [Caenorhabditis nigoni]